MTEPRPERLPHPAKVDRELDKLIRRCVDLRMLVDKVRKDYAEGYDASLSLNSSGEMPTLGRGFQESDPTGQTATNGHLMKLRWRAEKAARKVTHATGDLDEALEYLKAGFNIALDDGEWARWVEKRSAAEGR